MIIINGRKSVGYSLPSLKDYLANITIMALSSTTKKLYIFDHRRGMKRRLMPSNMEEFIEKGENSV